MEYVKSDRGTPGLDHSWHNTSVQNFHVCEIGINAEGFPQYTHCGVTTRYEHTGSLSYADAVAPLLDMSSPLGPIYYVFECYAKIAHSDAAHKGCAGIDPDTGQDNGNDDFGCGVNDPAATSTSLDITGGTFVAAPHGGNPAIGVPITSQSDDGRAPLGGDAGEVASELIFHGVLVNPSPDPALIGDLVFGPYIYPKECAFRADQIPSGSLGFAAVNFGAHGSDVTASIQPLAWEPSPSPAPPPLDCSSRRWSWGQIIDVDEFWDPANTDGRSDVDNQFLEIPTDTEEDDVLIVTMMMYMPSGDTPYLTFGTWPSGAPAFIDDTSEWNALPGFRSHNIYVRSWWRRGGNKYLANYGVNVNVYNFDAPVDPDGDSTEGGVMFMNVFRGIEDPSVAYQQGSTADVIPTPAPSPDSGYVLNHFFAKRANSQTQSIHGVVARIPSYPPGLEGISGSIGIPWMTTVLEDRRTHSETHPGYWDDLDLYAVGFYVAPGFFIEGYDGHAERVTWDMSEPEGFDMAFGAQGSVQQGIKIVCGDGAKCLICFV